MLPFIILHTSLLVASAAAQCSYSALQEVTTRYLAAQTAGQVNDSLTGVDYRENFRAADIKTGVLSKKLKIDFTRSFHDTVDCSTFTEVIVANGQHPYVIGTQMRVDPNGTVTQIDSLITDSGDWLFNATGTLSWAQRETWSVIPEAKRDTRETIKKAADAYLDLFSNKSVVVPWGTPCARLEGGAYTGRGLPTDSCNLGVPNNISLPNRRYVIDETLGSVDIFCNWGRSDGNPDSHLFRIEGGKLRFIHTLTLCDNGRRLSKRMCDYTG